MAGRKHRARRAANRYGHLNEPQAVLDFHDQGSLSGREIKQRTRAFIAAAVKAGHGRVRVVTGKGRRSRAEPVVKPQVLRTLLELEREGVIRTFQPETLQGGGEGALRIDL